MTVVRGGGVRLTRLIFSEDFDEDYEYLDANIQKRTDKTIKKLLMYPMPSGLGFEKLKGVRNPNIYTVHVSGNFKISMTIDGNVARLRHVGTHKQIDRAP